MRCQRDLQRKAFRNHIAARKCAIACGKFAWSQWRHRTAHQEKDIIEFYAHNAEIDNNTTNISIITTSYQSFGLWTFFQYGLKKRFGKI
jgi:hypothetical protein